MNLARTLYAVLAAAAVAAAVVPATPAAALSPGAGHRTGQAFARVSSAPALPARTARLGALAGAAVLHLEVSLKVRDEPALTALIGALSDRGSPQFHRFLQPGQFAARFGATAAQIAAVDAALRDEGITPGRVSANRLTIPVTATAAAVDRAMAAGVTRYRLPGGRVAFANAAAPRFPAAVAAGIQGVLGLSDVYTARSLTSVPRSPAGHVVTAAPRHASAAAVPGPKACTPAAQAAGQFGGFTASQLAAYYGMSPLYGMGDLGQGVRVALVEFEPNLASDVTAYENCYRISTKVNYVEVDNGAGTGDGSGEAALDIEDVAGLAPDATIDVYQAPNGTDADVYDDYAAIMQSDDQVVSTSWGDCEADLSSALSNDEHTLFQEAAAQGMTVLAAAGDEGSTGCFTGDPSKPAPQLSTGDPASQPDVIGVGGTTIAGPRQTVWNESAVEGGAGGGGVSGWCMPLYQHQPAIPGMLTAVNAACSTGYQREVPDVSADADPYTGYVYYFDGSWGGIGGTSAAAPLWAAISALIDASPFCADYRSGDAGVQPAGLYAVADLDHAYIYAKLPEVLADVTSGTNDYTPSGYAGKQYPARKGYDLASGLGTPLVTGLTAAGRRATGTPAWPR